ncbi:MAG: AlpA family phage regulatory protein [Candidatus Sericytochromatia bacterium]|uniref:AlpA family phage regulatory protein n=1 Tax=Candidatus Tanganyikabacteria bacterium TaxID=2961651 RepID=A0A937X232_9BACT|nr:AlpA family phage regulatory protein [Candidatus Tanganyikabacteria bacterium]
MTTDRQRSAPPRPLVVRSRDLPTVAGIGVTAATKLEKEGKFPVRVKIHDANGGVGWLYDELEAWIKSRPRGICGRETAKERGGAK